VNNEDLEKLCEAKREADLLKLKLRDVTMHGSESLSQKDKLICELQEKVIDGERMRRKMHNTIQELRGNVRVFARTRPFLPSDGTSDSSLPAISCGYDGQSLQLIRTGEKGTENYPFSFDRVFAPSVGQDAVFEVLKISFSFII